MDVIYQQANESKLNFNVPKGGTLHNVWNSLWEQCEAANDRLEGRKTCFPKPNTKSISNVMKMLTVFQNEVKGREVDLRSSDGQVASGDLCESCGLSKSKQAILEDNYDRRGKMIEYLLSRSSSQVAKPNQTFLEPYVYDEELNNLQPAGTEDNSPIPVKSSLMSVNSSPMPVSSTPMPIKSSPMPIKSSPMSFNSSPLPVKSTPFVQQRLYPQGRETQYKENPTNSLVQLLPNFTKYDPNKDHFTNMCLFEDECSQHNLGPRESCLMMKLWLPSQMSVRLASPVGRPQGGPQFWSNEGCWGDRQDRLKALAVLVTGDDDFGIDILEDLKVTPQDDPWEFSRKFEQAYRLIMGIKDSTLPPAMLKALVNKFTFLDYATRIAASNERTVDGIVKIVDKYRKSPHVKQTTLDQFSPNRRSMAEDERPKRTLNQHLQDASGDSGVLSDEPQNIRYFPNEREEHFQEQSGQPTYNRQEQVSIQIPPAGDIDIAEDPSMFSRNAFKQNDQI
ncbi:posterior protein-like [Dendropsophus ebraccatus]|uniref:posterior protein-like n=1 Tax=Dendropsophus ebraccatus TaxID=150705 RepID=UPI003831C1E4